MLLQDKVAIVTGSSSGIGAGIAVRFAQEGARVVVSYKENKEGSESVAERIKACGGEAHVIQGDLTQEADSTHLVEETIRHFGSLDILINNAGGYLAGDEWDGAADLWLKSLEQNLISVMSVSKYAIQHFKAQQSGIIVNISSRYSVMGQDDVLSYGSAKAGVVNITQAYAKLLASYGRANAVSPAALKSGYWLTAKQSEIDETLSQTLLKKFVEVEDVVELVLFLASDKSKMITGQNILVDGGYTLK